MYTIALTGGIASGKTVVSDMFAELGVEIIDTDIIAREVVEPGSEGLAQIAFAFGDSVLQDHGALNRRKLRDIVFANKDRLKKLEEITHPLIQNRARTLIDAANGYYCLLVVPLLFNSSMRDWADRTLAVIVNEDLQLQRLLGRDCDTVEQAKAIIATQASREQLMGIADDVIINDAGLEKLRKEVHNLHLMYTKLAQNCA
ncbi:MAG: dephospho-CoA kinase [Gammaproteobacteria bacterium]|nr:MAG: dephospho-CoA kinase [Gammaproteobacteria bacterium]